ncbi:MAG: sulfatase-like hydrolase/transferase [Chloroflexi bacterium]|jgi:arylsulfatase A-like enzyme|nr:sulfatase-like hydrolase/transferase [Chloroflexota bacterium]MBT5320116.1 sulfatase-like hydrolase/transferase [Chloroflexota bacterium]MBT6681507.1 sulfatase-like hydrolase/transferase [Chloroflexota bacterium]
MPQKPDRPNILVIITDQQRADTMACYGNDWIQTPNMNALADGSFVFQNAYVTQPVCTPSRSTMLTGTYPHTNGLVRNSIALAPDALSIAEMVSPEYRRLHYGKWHLGNDASPQHGFQDWISTGHVDPGPDGTRQSDYHAWLAEQGVELPEHYVRPGGDGAGSERAVAQANLSEDLTQAAFVGDITTRFLREEADEPFLLFTNFFEPHPPYSGPLGDMYDAATLPVGPEFLRSPEGHSLFNRSRSEFYLAGDHREDSVAGCDHHDLHGEAGWRALRANYMANITLVDRQVGRILQALEESGHADDTIVVFTSDHGDMLGDHGLLEKRAFYDGSARVPLLVRVPWMSETKTVIPGSVGHIDLVPTLLDLIGESIPEHLQGESKAAVLRGEKTLADNDVFVQWNGRGDRDLGTLTINDMIALPRRTIVSGDRWKLNLCEGDDGELFDLTADPHELTNLFNDPAQGGRVRSMGARIRAWQEDTGDTEPLPVI